LLPPSLAELELPLSVVPEDCEPDVVELELELVTGVVVVVELVPVAALWPAATAVTPNSTATPATVEATATRMRVVRERTGGVMHPGWPRRLSRTCRHPVPVLWAVTPAGR
jgi:hypothetical protein